MRQHQRIVGRRHQGTALSLQKRQNRGPMVVAATPDTPCFEPLQLPLQLAQELRLSPEQFELVCQANPDAVLELSADGHLIAMTPTGSETSARNSTLVVLLGLALRASECRSNSSTVPVASACRMDRCSALLHRWYDWSAGRR